MNFIFRLLVLSILFYLPNTVFSQGQNEDQITFELDSDMDLSPNKIDTDDDDDLVLDNNDLFPLDPLLSSAVILDSLVKASDDAGLRNNSAATANKNYGADPTIETKNSARSFIMKFPVPDLNIEQATLTIYTDSEDDELSVYFLPDNNWDESTITYNSANLANEVLLGQTSTPSATPGEYTFDVPTSILSTAVGEVTLWVYDEDDSSKENLYTKEHEGDAEEDNLGDQAPSLNYFYTIPIMPRLVLDPLNMESIYLENGPLKLGVKLRQQPSSDVFVPFEIIDQTKATITGDEVLTFNSSNWDTYDTIFIDPIAAGNYDINIRPLHSLDTYFNGNNPIDLKDYLNQTVEITNLMLWTVTTGNTLSEQLHASSSNGTTVFDFRIVDGPSGLSVVENSGEVIFSPLSTQLGPHDVTIEVTDEFGFLNYFTTTVTVLDGGITDPVGIYVDPNADDDPTADGTSAKPFKDIDVAVTEAVANLVDKVFIRGGEYDLSAVIQISDSASVNAPITICPLPGEIVKFNFASRAAFEFTETAKNMTLENVEIDGGTDEVDFWCIVSQALYYDLSIPRGGGLAVILEGENLAAKNNYVHDCYQKAVEIKGRYIIVQGNIIHSIATTSLSGGHGIMRQQKGREFFDDDDPNLYRWEIKDNLIYNVEQRIYSWVPSKGFMEMTLDEGKPILIDDPKDSDGVQEEMKAIIKNNVIAFGSIDHIRLKSTPNLEVSNNSIYSESTHADGITDKVGDFEKPMTTSTPQFTNFIFTNNAVQVDEERTAIEIDDAVEQTNTAGGTPIVTDNRYAGGGQKPNNQTGLIDEGNVQLFVDPNYGNFALNPALSLPVTVGIDPAILSSLESRATDYNVVIKWDGWTNDDMKLTQTIIDNIPGVNDGIPNNETAFTDAGEVKLDTSDELVIRFDVTTAFQGTSGAPDTMHFRLNEQYVEWYEHTEEEFKNANGEDYTRLRWGCSILKQDQIFVNDWLTYSQITSDTTNTVILSENHLVKVDGDLLIDFEDYKAPPGTCFDLILADSIASANTAPDLFDRVLFKGDTLETNEYALTIEDRPNGMQAVQLKILGDCKSVLTVTDAGEGSLRAAIDCAMDGDTIYLTNIISNDTIKLTSTKLTIDKSVTIISEGTDVIVQNCVLGNELDVAAAKSVKLVGFTILSDNFVNNGALECEDVTFRSKNSLQPANFTNKANATLIVDGEVKIE